MVSAISLVVHCDRSACPLAEMGHGLPADETGQMRFPSPELPWVRTCASVSTYSLPNYPPLQEYALRTNRRGNMRIRVMIGWIEQRSAAKNRRTRITLGLAVVLAGCPSLATTSFAHVTLAVQQAPIGAEYKAIFRVPHGCKGSATVKLSVEMPGGIVDVKPQPKPGWQIEIVKGSYDKPYHLGHSEVTEGVKTVTWSGGSLPDDYYDEFVLIGHLDKGLQPGSRMYFPTIQTCEQGSDNWVEIPNTGKSSHDYRFPAPSLKLQPPVENAN